MLPLSIPTWLPLRCHETLTSRFAVINANRAQNESIRRWVNSRISWATLLLSSDIAVATSRATAEIHRASQCLMSLYRNTIMYNQARTSLRHFWKMAEHFDDHWECVLRRHVWCGYGSYPGANDVSQKLVATVPVTLIPRIRLQYSHCRNDDNRFDRSRHLCARVIRHCGWKDYAYHQ